MILSWLGCFIWLYLLFLAIRRKRLGVQANRGDVLEDDVLTDDMSEFERAAAVVSSGKYYISDAAVILSPSNHM